MAAALAFSERAGAVLTACFAEFPPGYQDAHDQGDGEDQQHVLPPGHSEMGVHAIGSVGGFALGTTAESSLKAGMTALNRKTGRCSSLNGVVWPVFGF